MLAFFSSVHSNYQYQFYAPDPQLVTMKDGTAELSKACHGRRNTMRRDGLVLAVFTESEIITPGVMRPDSSGLASCDSPRTYIHVSCTIAGGL